MIQIRSNAYETRYLELEVWEISQDPGSNISTVGWKLSSVGGYSAYYYIADTTVTIGSQQVYFYDAPAWDTNWAAKTFPVKTGQISGELTVPHNADGRKTLTASLSTRVYVSTTPAVYSGSLTLTDIERPQAATLTAADMVLGERCQVAWTPQGNDLYHKLQFVVGTRFQSVGGICPGTTAPYTYRGIPLGAELALGLPNAASGEMTVTLTAHRDFACTAAAQVGQALTATCRVTVPQTADFLPQVSMTLSPDEDLPGLEGLYIQGKTGIRASITAQGKQGAGIQAWTLTAQGSSVSGGSGELTLDALTGYGDIPVTGTVQDSRGMTATVQTTVTVLPYARPKVLPLPGQSRVAALRCDASGAPGDSGAYLMVKARRGYSPVTYQGEQKNGCTLAYRWRRETDSAWSAWTVLLEEGAVSDEITTPPLLGILDPNASYQIQLRARDRLGEEAVTTVTVSTQQVYSHRHGPRGSFAFGKLAEEDNVFDLAPDKTLILRGGLRLSQEAALVILDLCHPVGSILETRSGENPAQTLGGSWAALPAQEEGLHRWERVEA